MNRLARSRSRPDQIDPHQRTYESQAQMPMVHLLAPVTEPEALSAYKSGLSAAHAALTARLVTTAGKVTPPPLV